MSYDEAVEAAAEAIGDVLGFEHSSLQNRPMARAAINAALPHLKGGYDREAIEAAERRGAVRALREAAAGEGLPDTLSRKHPKGRVRNWLLERARRIEQEGQQ